MVGKVKLGEKEYEFENLSDKAKNILALFQFSNKRLDELSGMKALLSRAKKSYAKGLKKEVLSKKAGLLIEDD